MNNKTKLESIEKSFFEKINSDKTIAIIKKEIRNELDENIKNEIGDANHEFNKTELKLLRRLKALLEDETESLSVYICYTALSVSIMALFLSIPTNQVGMLISITISALLCLFLLLKIYKVNKESKNRLFLKLILEELIMELDENSKQ